MAAPDSRATPQMARQVEGWFLHHGLPYFVDPCRAVVERRLARGRLVVVGLLVTLLALAAGVPTGLASGSVSLGTSTGATVLLAGLGLYALRALQTMPIAAWALRRALGSLGLLVPLATRALPMLLLFVTFLFINTEVWQVASALHGGVLWGTVLFFAVAGVGFLVPRLAEELDRFDDAITAEDVLESAIGTPWEPAARDAVEASGDLAESAQVRGLQMVNLVLTLVVAQAVQVLLLAAAIFVFFVVFGAVAIDDSVVHTWVGEGAPSYPLPGPHLVSIQLIRVSLFLASFSGLYFTVYALTDDLYRREFFTAILRELRRAVGARVVYRHLQR